MDGAKFPKLGLFTVFLVLAFEMSHQVPTLPPFAPRPLCMSQFALANQACHFLPFNPVPPPSRPSPPSLPGHGHRHGHSGRQSQHQETPVEQECCRWVKEVDSECVCDILVRLPLFLAKPMHRYIVHVDASCNVTYQCAWSPKL